MIYSTIYTLDGELSNLLLPKFSFEKIINAKREIVFEIFSNYDNYQKILPKRFPSVRVRSVRGNTSVAEEHMNFGDFQLINMAKHVLEKPILHEIFVIGGDAKGSYIKHQFIELAGKTKILVDVDIKLKGKKKIIGLFGKSKFEQFYVDLLSEFTKIAEN